MACTQSLLLKRKVLHEASFSNHENNKSVSSDFCRNNMIEVSLNFV